MKQAKKKNPIKASVEKKKKSGQKMQNKKEKKLHVLILEDNPADAELMERQLKKADIHFAAQRVDTRSEYLKALKAFKPDLILADYKLPKFDALQALALRKKTSPQIPFIIVTGTISEEVAVECMKHGADDYLLKDRLARLGEAVKQALEKHRLQSEKNEAEKESRTRKLLYRTFIDASSDMAFLKDDKFRHLIANQALCRFFGKTDKEINGKTDYELMGRSAAAHCRRSDRLALKKQGIVIQKEAVGDRFFETHKFLVQLVDGRIGVGGYIRDISERQRLEESIQRRAEEWIATFDAISDSIALLDLKGIVQRCNRAFSTMVGKPFKEIIGRPCGLLVRSEGGKKPWPLLRRVLLSKKPLRAEAEISGRQFDLSFDPILDAQGRIQGLVYALKDVSERKQSEAALQRSEEHFRALTEKSPFGIVLIELSGNWLYINPRFSEMTGYKLSEVGSGKTWFKKAFPDADYRRMAIDEWKSDFQDIIAGQSSKRQFRVRTKNREYRILNILTAMIATDQVMLVFDDVTEVRRAEEALREMNEIFRLFLKHSPIYVFIKDENIRPVYLSENYEKMLGRPLAEILGKNMDELFPSELSRAMIEDDKRILREGQPCEFIEELDGRMYSTLKFPILIQGKAKYLAGYTTDITEHKQAEVALKESEERFREQYHGSPIAVFTWLKQGESFVLQGYNASAEKITLGRVREFVGKSASALYANRPDILWAFRQCVDKKSPVSLETSSEHFIPGRQVLSTYAFIPPDLVMVHLEDITERRQAEKKIRESEEKFRSIVENSSDQIFMLDKDFKFLSMNKTGADLFRKSPQEMIGKSIFEVFPENIAAQFSKNVKNVFYIGKSILEEEKILLQGHELYFSTSLNPVKDDSGNVMAVAGIVRDITERRKMEDELKDSEIRYHDLFENSSEFIYTLDLKGNFTDVNKAALALTGYTKSELLKMNFKDYTPKRDHRKLFRNLFNVYKTGKPLQNLLIEAIIKDKSKKYFETSISLLKKGELIIGFQGSSKDISERKHAEEQMQASLREKEVLLKEIHHRVKNNLQVISGLLTLQAGQSNDERLQGMIKESQGRIWTMALIHQTLYQSGNLAAIDMADYIRNLVGNLLSSHAQVAMPPTVSFDLLPLRLVIDKAIPLALIVNELVTNAMKHAFPDGRAGEICITLHKCRGTARCAPTENTDATPREGITPCAPTYELTVADNGVGLPAGFNPADQKSLGLQLVTMLTKQLDGTLAIESSKGTAVTITFSNNEKNEKKS